MYNLFSWGASSGLALSAPGVCVICTWFLVTKCIRFYFFFFSLSLALTCPSMPVFLIKVAALRAYLCVASIDFVVILLHVYPFYS